MDAFLAHLQQAARAQPADRRSSFLRSFGRANSGGQSVEIDFGFPAAHVLAALAWVLRDQQFDVGGGVDYARGLLRATLSRDYPTRQGPLGSYPNLGGDLLHVRFHVDIEALGGTRFRLATSHPLPGWVDGLCEAAAKLLAATPPDLLATIPVEYRDRPALPAATPGEARPTVEGSDRDDAAARPAAEAFPGLRLLGPGEELTRPPRGDLKDYSGFAGPGELGDLAHGELPLGRYAFGVGDDLVRGGRLFVGRFRTGAPMIYNGALVCAPQNSGKTALLRRWAVAANRARWNVLIIDVKGTMLKDIGPRLTGKVRYFSTDPDVRDCDRINFLAGIHGLTPQSGQRVRQVAEALLPDEGWEEGEQAYFRQNHVNWLAGLMQLLLLYRLYRPEAFGPEREVTLGHLYELASDHDTLLRVIRELRVYEGAMAKAGKRFPFPGVGYWFKEVSLLVDRQEDGGQRPDRHSYRELTQSVCNALRPFSVFGTMHGKTGGTPAAADHLGPYFTLEELGTQDEPVTIVVAAREQDLDDGTTVLSLVIDRLRYFLFQRMGKPGLRPILLLLDETRRIPGFRANEYITFAREAQAGCVLTYQSLDQIGGQPQIAEILENVGVQVYLGSLIGATAKYFTEMLPARYRPMFSVSQAFGTDGISHAVQTGLERVPYVTPHELYQLPAGEWPALIYICDQPRRKPFLTDMTQEPPDE